MPVSGGFSSSLVQVVAVGLIVLVQCTAGAPAAAAEDRSAQTDLTPAASGTNARCKSSLNFDLLKWDGGGRFACSRMDRASGELTTYRPYILIIIVILCSGKSSNFGGVSSFSNPIRR